jgi:hypothetical protein
MEFLTLFNPNGLMYILWVFVDSSTLQSLINTCLANRIYFNKALDVVHTRIQFPYSILPLQLTVGLYDPLWFQQYSRLRHMDFFDKLCDMEDIITEHFSGEVFYDPVYILELLHDHLHLRMEIGIEYSKRLEEVYSDECYRLRTDMFIEYGQTFLNPITGKLIYLGTCLPEIDPELLGFTEKTDAYFKLVKDIIDYNPEVWVTPSRALIAFHEFKPVGEFQ